mmetsp:Transcript_34420/g.89081  ORF Transcript_34420/g.89081 Transcript_34420/m.89081 type:complete len:201 (-) Transcript_34420:2441-3043(-)
MYLGLLSHLQQRREESGLTLRKPFAFKLENSSSLFNISPAHSIHEHLCWQVKKRITARRARHLQHVSPTAMSVTDEILSSSDFFASSLCIPDCCSSSTRSLSGLKSSVVLSFFSSSSIRPSSSRHLLRVSRKYDHARPKSHCHSLARQGGAEDKAEAALTNTSSTCVSSGTLPAKNAEREEVERRVPFEDDDEEEDGDEY